MANRNEELPGLIDGRYTFRDLVDLRLLREVFENFSKATGFTAGLVTFPDHELLTGAGSQDIHTRFHSAFAITVVSVDRGNDYSQLPVPQEMVFHKCESGLVEAIFPIIVNGIHIASLTSGQILFSAPDFEIFRKQGEACGSDVEAYLQAIRKIPVVSEGSLKTFMAFLGGYIVMLAEQGLVIQQNRLLLKETKEREEKYRALVESSADWIWEVNSNWIYVYAGPQVEKLLGYKPEEILGLTPFDIMPPEEAFRVREVVQKLLDENVPSVRVENLNIRADGRRILLETIGVAVFNEAGRVTGYRGIDRDITERKQAEEDQRRMSNLESIGVMAGGIAHDFNNILTGVFGNIELAKLRLPQEHKANLELETAVKVLEKAKSLTKQLLTFSKGCAPVLESIDLADIVRDSVKFNLSGSNVMDHLDLPEGLWPIKADKGQISQVIANLIINARQAMPDGGAIFVIAQNVAEGTADAVPQSAGDLVKFSVRDEGTGIPTEFIQRVFDPYFSTKRTGKGLGLAIVQRIVTRHNGFIGVTSVPDAGTTFTVYLPANRSATVIAPIVAVPTDNAVQSPVSGHILVMDDDMVIRDVTGNMLESLGYSFEFAIDGKEALEKYVTARNSGKAFDAVIMDLTVRGGMGGLEAIARLREIDAGARTIVFSGYSNNAIVANYQEYGFNGRLSKPFQIFELKDELLRVMSGQV